MSKCVHYRMRPEVVLCSAAELAAPGVLKARNEWDLTFAPSSLPDDGRQLCSALRLLSHLPG